MTLYPTVGLLLSPEEQKLPVEVQRCIVYSRQLEKLHQEYPNLIMVHGFDALADYLRYHRWCREDIRKAIPLSADWFRYTIGRDIPFILSTQTVRKVYPDMFEGMSLEACHARRLYDPKDVLEWLRENLVSTITSVLVPLGMMTRDPEGLRKIFQEVSRKRLSDAVKHRCRSNSSKPERISSWPEIIDMILPEYRTHFGAFRDDLSRMMVEQGTTQRAYVKLPEVEVKLPDDKLPRFFTQKEVALTRGYRSFSVSLTTIKFFAWAEHRLREPNRFLTEKNNLSFTKAFYTQGLFPGGDRFAKDYELGLVDVMTAQRFIDVFGMNALQNAQWRFSKDLCRWHAEGARFGLGLPPKVFGILQGGPSC